MNAKGDTLADVKAVLAHILQLDQRTTLAADTRLLGGIPEFDSLAVASVVIALEEHFGLEFDDEDINAELFETVGTLAAFIDQNKPDRANQSSAPEAYFLATTSGSLFVIRHDPVENPESRCVIFVAPFGEEMNRVRSLVTSAAIDLNEAGLSCCCFDFHGTGDSEGEFSDARWSLWLADLHDIVNDLRSQGFRTIDLVAIRLGALLAVEFVSTMATEVARIVFWDPVFDGKTYVDHFLRTRAMAAMISGKTEGVKELRARLESGQVVEVGGYDLHPELAAGIAGFVPAQRHELDNTSLYWLSRSDSAQAQSDAADSGLHLTRIVALEYEPYWSSVETTTAPALIEATRQCLMESIT